MSKATLRRPDGRPGTYGQWLGEVAARWQSLSVAEQHASRDAAASRLGAGIRAQADGGPSLLHIYDEIGFFGVWAADVADALNGIKGDVEVHLNSPGGSIFDGTAIYNSLLAHPGQVGVVVDGLAASAASFIAQAASPGRLEMTENGTMMIHEAWGGCVGPAGDMRAMADALDQQTDNIASIYARRGGQTAAEYRGLMAAETWMVGQEAVDLGLADRVRVVAAKGGDAPAALPVAASVPWQVNITTGGKAVKPRRKKPKASPAHESDNSVRAGFTWSPDAFLSALQKEDQ